MKKQNKKRIKIIALFAGALLVLSFFVGCWPVVPLPPMAYDIPDGVVGIEYSGTVGSIIGARVHRSNINFRVQSGSFLPGGLRLNTSNGEISGVPSLEGDFTFIIEAFPSPNATMSFGVVAQSFSMSVARGSLQFSPNNQLDIPFGMQTQLNLSDFVLGHGGLPLNFEIVNGRLPDGLELDATGYIIGVATEFGQIATIRLRADHSQMLAVTRDFIFTVTYPRLGILESELRVADIRHKEPYAFVLPRALVNVPVSSFDTRLSLNEPSSVTYYRIADAQTQMIINALGFTFLDEGIIYTDYLDASSISNLEGVILNQNNSGTDILYTFWLNFVAEAEGYLPIGFSKEFRVLPTRTNIADIQLAQFQGGNRNLPTAHRLAPYTAHSQNIARITGVGQNHTNHRVIRYFIADNSPDVLPDGFRLFQNGLLHFMRDYNNGILSKTEIVRDLNLTIRASIVGRNDETADFILPIREAHLRFFDISVSYHIERGQQIAIRDGFGNIEEYGISLRKSTIPLEDMVNDVDPYENLTTYTLANLAGNYLPSDVDIVNGKLVGAPYRAYGIFSFVITASRVGYYPRNAVVTINIQEQMVDTGGIFEFEFSDISRRRDISADGARGIDMVRGGSDGAWNGFYFGGHYTNAENINASVNPPFIFDFFALETQRRLTIIVRLASARLNETSTWNNANFSVELNGEEMTTTSHIANWEHGTRLFEDWIITLDANIIAGLNTLRVRVLANNYGPNGLQGAPGLDHIRFAGLSATNRLSWRPHTYNLRFVNNAFWQEAGVNIYRYTPNRWLA